MPTLFSVFFKKGRIHIVYKQNYMQKKIYIPKAFFRLDIQPKKAIQ